MNECQVWWTITGNFGNMMPIDWSKSTARAKHLPTLNLNTRSSVEKLDGDDDRKDKEEEEDDDIVAADLDMHALILNSNSGDGDGGAGAGAGAGAGTAVSLGGSLISQRYIHVYSNIF